MPYAWLVIAAPHATTLSWGDTATLDGFFGHLLRRDYGTLQLGADGGAVTLGRIGTSSAPPPLNFRLITCILSTRILIGESSHHRGSILQAGHPG
jgi:hypothetical protein